MGTSFSPKNRALEKILKKEGLFPNTSAPWQQAILDGLLSKIDLSKNSLCLDAASGIGNNINTLSKYFTKIVALDKSRKSLAFSKNINYPQSIALSFKIANIESMPYETDFFDCVVCTEALEHTYDYRLAILEIIRVTKPNGYIILSFQNHFNFASVIKYFYEKLFRKNWDVWGTHIHTAGYENYLTCFQVKSFFKKNEMTLVDELGADYINAWLSWLPFLYRNYKILNRFPLIQLGKLPLLKYFGMDYFMLIKKPRSFFK